MQELYTPKEVATYLKVSYRTVLDLINDGKLMAIEVPGGYRVTEDDLKEYIQNNGVNIDHIETT